MPTHFILTEDHMPTPKHSLKADYAISVLQMLWSMNSTYDERTAYETLSGHIAYYGIITKQMCTF